MNSRDGRLGGNMLPNGADRMVEDYVVALKALSLSVTTRLSDIQKMLLSIFFFVVVGFTAGSFFSTFIMSLRNVPDTMVRLEQIQKELIILRCEVRALREGTDYRDCYIPADLMR